MSHTKTTDLDTLLALVTPAMIYAWITFLCALFGIFYIPLIILLCLVSTTALFYTKILRFQSPSRSLRLLLIISLLLAISIALIAEPSVFGGRDQGSISDAAFLLQQNASILHASPEVTAFSQIYGPGQALNFPGFHYTVRGELYPQFPLPYIAFLAGFVGLFGITGFLIANAILTFLFILLTTLCMKALVGIKASWWFLVLLVSSFPVLWFAKFTLSENLAGVLVWTAIYLLITLREKVRPQIVWLFIATVTLVFFTRIEGLWLTPILLYSMWKIPNCKKMLTQNTWRHLWLPSIFFGIIGLTTLIMSTPFYKTVFSALIPDHFKTFISQSSSSPQQETAQHALSFLGEFTSFLIPVYAAYGLFFPLIITALIIAYIIHKQARHPFLLLLAITAPLFLYFIDPQISADHPWMLRRFVWIILPVILGATVLAAHLWSNTKNLQPSTQLSLGMKSLLIIIITINLFTTVRFAFFAPNDTLLNQVESLANNFTSDDLILLAPDVTGDGWSMIDAPLRNYFDRHAVYFFNQKDYPKLDTTAFSNVYLITPIGSIANYQLLIQEAQTTENFTFHANRLSKEIDTFDQIPIIVQKSFTNTIYKLR